MEQPWQHTPRFTQVSLTPNTVELIPALRALPPRGEPFQDPVLTQVCACQATPKVNRELTGDLLLRKNVKRFRGRLVFNADRLLYHSTQGSRVIKRFSGPAAGRQAVLRRLGGDLPPYPVRMGRIITCPTLMNPPSEPSPPEGWSERTEAWSRKRLLN